MLVRIVANEMSEHFGQPVVVENRAIAAGAIGLANVVRSPADGYTIAIANTGPLAINLAMYPALPYDPLKDLSPISELVNFQYLLVANPRLNIHASGELIEYAKKYPGKLNYASEQRCRWEAFFLTVEILRRR